MFPNFTQCVQNTFRSAIDSVYNISLLGFLMCFFFFFFFTLSSLLPKGIRTGPVELEPDCVCVHVCVCVCVCVCVDVFMCVVLMLC